MVVDLRKVPTDAKVVKDSLAEVLEELGVGSVHWVGTVGNPNDRCYKGKPTEELVILCTRDVPGYRGPFPIFVEVKNKDNIHFRGHSVVDDYTFDVAHTYEAKNPSTVVSIRNM